ncbi:zinc finger CCCH-type containing 7Ba isoform X2 [Pygocentrus nattereri]|uniref:C3H1-type domain-containing protein n=1 Tax=Pygocentrus nattereri TaxID=42514 RepID=A0A3B4CAM4_PYGNA|nr:zinc finger CCCH-type containing 7Ba isoform X2 [Pygocentrus nattereri]
MNMERQKRKEEIQRALAFIQSSLPFPDPDGYEGFMMQLVCNLLDEGNAAFCEGEWTLARGHFSEGISVARYAQAEGLKVPVALLESLYVNRAAALHNMGEFELGVRDCDNALSVSKDSGRALYRKAVCLKELGKYKEAYECSTTCLLTSPQDKKVSELAQELANKLDLKTRKAYVGLQPVADGSGDSLPSLEPIPNGLDNLCDVAVGFSECVSPVLPAPVPVSDACEDPLVARAAVLDVDVSLSVPVSEPLGDCELMGEELDTLLDSCVSTQEELLQTSSKGGVVPTHVPAGGVMGLGPSFPPLLPAPSPHLPPAFFPSAVNQLNTLDTFSEPNRDLAPPNRPLDALDSFSPLDAPPQGSVAPQPSLVVGGEGLDSLSEFTLPGGKVSHSFFPQVKIKSSTGCINSTNGRVASTLSQLSKNPLEHTHDFTQACSACFTRIGPGVLDCEYKVDLGHFCKKDILLCRRKGANPWRRVRPRPTRNNFLGSYVLCKEVLEHQDCKYGEACTFAYCQEEIDVWTQERRGLLTRELLFNPLSTNQRQALSVLRLLNSHKGMFMFLCEECFDYKPRIISKRYKESPSLCSNGVSHHQFDKNKCLVHVVKNSSICYNKIRPLSYHCQFDVCPRRHSCPLENSCSLAHSVIELECWILQKDRGTTHEEIVQESKKHWHKQRPGNLLSSQTDGAVAKGEGVGKGTEMNGKLGAVQSSGMVAVGTGNVLAVKDLRLMMKFVCSQCWKDGLMSEPDKTQKYCSSKARHSWTKERKVLLVKSQDREKWVSIRPLPFAKTYPQQYDICVHVLKQKKCHYIGNCSFAHSHEERELWTYMKNTGLRDLQHVYDVWLSTANQNKRIEGTPLSQSVEEKQITMPTDFAEPIDGFHCRLCGKHSNSERQWQQHISSERHKDRVLSGAGEEENLTWIHRFPGHCFALCPRLQTGCDEGVSCDFAHSDEELQEWRDRRDFLRRRLDKARADMLIAPTDNDFGKYNFLLQD